MRVGILRSLAALLAGTGVVTAQAPAPGSGSGLSGQMLAAAPAQVAPAGPLPSYSPLAQPDGWMPSGCSNCGLGDDCPRPTSRFYGSAEFLVWRFRHDSLPPLATSVPVGLLRVASQNTLAVPGGTVPFGPPQTALLPVALVSNPRINPALEPADQLGGRVTIGYWLDPAQRFGVEASALVIQPRVTNFISTTGNAVNQFTINTGLTNQVFALMGSTPVPSVTNSISTTGAAVNQLTINTGLTLNQLMALPSSSLIGSSPVVVPRQTTAITRGDFRSQLLGSELNARCLGCQIGPVTFSGLSGARYLEFREGLNVSNSVSLSTIPGIPDPPLSSFPPLINFASFDSITTRNRYYAPQVGAEMDFEAGGVFLNARAKVGVGVMQQIADIFGASNIVGSPNPSSPVGGLLSDPINQGRRYRTRVSVVPEANLKIGYQFNNWLRTYVGYDYLYLQHVIRPSTIIGSSSVDTQVTVNGSTQTINVSQPAIRLRDQDTWVQGINLGVELRY